MERLKLVFWLLLIAGAAAIVFVLLRGSQLVVRNPGSFQAVFLDNGQVYFGKLQSVNQELWSLTDVYYLRAGSVQQGQEAAVGGTIDLIKLGAEVHAPKDEMIINKSHVIFYEDIGETGQVMQLIRKHEQGR